MEVVLRKMGNSTGVSFPPSILKDFGLKAGQVMNLEKTRDGAIKLVPKRKYTLSDLLAQCDLKAPAPADMAVWVEARPVGREGL